MSETNKNKDGWAFVKNVANEQEAVLVESVLGTEGIPVKRKHKENGDYLEIYMGMSQYGLDLFVPEDALELAKGLLESDVIDMPEEIDIEENIKAEAKYQVKRKSIVWIILTYLFLPLILGIIIGIIINR
jgi:hypothetical protein